jgi:hypothetical protein
VFPTIKCYTSLISTNSMCKHQQTRKLKLKKMFVLLELLFYLLILSFICCSHICNVSVILDLLNSVKIKFDMCSSSFNKDGDWSSETKTNLRLLVYSKWKNTFSLYSSVIPGRHMISKLGEF